VADVARRRTCVHRCLLQHEFTSHIKGHCAANDYMRVRVNIDNDSVIGHILFVVFTVARGLLAYFEDRQHRDDGL
jgi:hypothetical protein